MCLWYIHVVCIVRSYMCKQMVCLSAHMFICGLKNYFYGCFFFFFLLDQKKIFLLSLHCLIVIFLKFHLCDLFQ